MRLTNVFRWGCVVVAGTFAVVALSAVSVSTIGSQGMDSVDQDFLVLRHEVSEATGAMRSTGQLIDSEVLVDWKFTDGGRPKKCRGS